MMAGRKKRHSLRIAVLVAAAGPAVALVTACSAMGGAAGAGASARAHPVTGPAHAAAADVRAAAVSRAAATPSAHAPHSSSGAAPASPAAASGSPAAASPARAPARGGRGPPGDVREPGQPDHLGRRRAEPGAPAGPDRLETPARAQPDDHRPQALERPLLGPDRLRVPCWPWPLPVRRLRWPLPVRRQRGHPGHPGRVRHERLGRAGLLRREHGGRLEPVRMTSRAGEPVPTTLGRSGVARLRW